jgi:hypothetical protein
LIIYYFKLYFVVILLKKILDKNIYYII